MDYRIKFGTSGWRGVIAEDFTFGNVRKVSRGIRNYLLNENLGDRGVVIGYDTRFLSKEFAIEVSKILAEGGIKVFFLKEPSPTPVISYTILKYKTSGGVNITASHNPYYFSGIKFSPSWGGPAEPEVTRKIEEYINKESDQEIKGDFDDFVNNGLIEIIDPIDDYINDLLKILPYEFELNNKIILDPMFGTGIRYFNKIFERYSDKVFTIHSNFDPLFGGLEPVPYEEFLFELKKEVLEKGALIGLALDGDADRFGVISSDGTFITPNEVLSILAFYLGKDKKEGIGRTISTTRLIDKIAKYYNIEVFETPVGFKFIGMLIRDGKIYIGGEESGGLSIKGWLPEKDGILADLLILQICEKERVSPKKLIDDLYEKFGKFYTKRIDLRFKKEEREIIKNYIDNFNENQIFNLKIKNIDRRDGLLINLESEFSYILFRISGTEEVIRVYFETIDKKLFEFLKKEILNFIDKVVR